MNSEQAREMAERLRKNTATDMRFVPLEKLCSDAANLLVRMADDVDRLNAEAEARLKQHLEAEQKLFQLERELATAEALLWEAAKDPVDMFDFTSWIDFQTRVNAFLSRQPADGVKDSAGEQQRSVNDAKRCLQVVAAAHGEIRERVPFRRV